MVSLVASEGSFDALMEYPMGKDQLGVPLPEMRSSSGGWQEGLYQVRADIR